MLSPSACIRTLIVAAFAAVLAFAPAHAQQVVTITTTTVTWTYDGAGDADDHGDMIDEGAALLDDEALSEDDDSVGRIAMVTDPQGAPFYIMDPVPPEGGGESDVFSVTEPQRVRWNELATSDPDAAIAFYKKHFGWGQEGEMPMGELGAYRFIQRGDVGLGAVMPLMDGYPAPVWNFYIGVDDIDRAHAAVKANGGTITNEPMEIPGGEYAMNAIDPQGAPVGFVGPRP